MGTSLDILGRAVKRAQHRQHRTVDAALGAVGTTIVQWDALRAIGRNAGASAHDLALATFQTDQAFGTLAARLEAQGLVTRIPGQGRRIEHRLTPAGEQKLAEANIVAEKKRSDLFAPLSASDRRELLRLLEKLLAAEPDGFPKG